MLAIAGGKGGVGKTTTALGLAAALPDHPLVVDADRDMPDLHALAEVNRTPGLDAVVACQPDSAAPAATPTGDYEDENGDSVCGATASVSSDPNETVGQPCPNHNCRVLPAPDGDAPRTDQLLDRLAATYGGEAGSEQSILVDTPAGVSVDAAAPLQAVDGVLLVSTACAPALRDAAKTASMARAVGTPVVGVVLTRVITRPPGVGELLDCPVVGCIPTRATRPLESRRVRERYAAVASRLQEAVPADIL